MSFFGKLAQHIVRIGGKDALGAERVINTVVRGDGITAMPIDGTVIVSSTFGADQQPMVVAQE